MKYSSGQVVVYFFAKPEAAVEHVTLDLTELKPCCLSKRVTLVGPLGRGNNWNHDNRRRNINANDNWSNDAEMTLAYNLGILFLLLFLLLFYEELQEPL